MESFILRRCIGGYRTIPANLSACELLLALHRDRDINKLLRRPLAELLERIRDVATQEGISLRICGARKEPTVQLWRRPRAEPVPIQFPFKELPGDAAKWGVADFYDKNEKALREALTSRAPFDTGWYSVKKEIEHARICRAQRNGPIEVEVSAEMDDTRDLIDTAFWAANGKNATADSGWDALAKLGLTQDEIAAAIGQVASGLGLGDENTTRQNGKVGGRSGFDRLCAKLRELEEECGDELEAQYQGIVVACQAQLALLRKEAKASCATCLHFKRKACQYPRYGKFITQNLKFPFVNGCKFWESPIQPARDEDPEER